MLSTRQIIRIVLKIKLPFEDPSAVGAYSKIGLKSIKFPMLYINNILYVNLQ